MSDKPTIHELEAIMAEDDPGKVEICPDGSVIVREDWKAARAMDRIEAAGRRVEMSQLDRRQFQWHVIEESIALKMIGEYGAERWKYVPWSAIRDDEQDPLEAAEQAAMEELRHE